MVPARVALALQADGWWLRSDIIWAKPNPMPSSQRDRPTVDYEHVFLLSKSERYYFDMESVKEPLTESTVNRYKPSPPMTIIGQFLGSPTDKRFRNGKKIKGSDLPNNRSMRSVWNIATQPYCEAHFATYPEELARRCILAGTSEKGCCPECGMPWERIVEKKRPKYRDGVGGSHGTKGPRGEGMVMLDKFNTETQTLGWRPTCDHDGDPVPCTVFDLFAGSGTTLKVAYQLGRRAIGMDIAYHDLAATRIWGPMFARTINAEKA